MSMVCLNLNYYLKLIHLHIVVLTLVLTILTRSSKLYGKNRNKKTYHKQKYVSVDVIAAASMMTARQMLLVNVTVVIHIYRILQRRNICNYINDIPNIIDFNNFMLKQIADTIIKLVVCV